MLDHLHTDCSEGATRDVVAGAVLASAPPVTWARDTVRNGNLALRGAGVTVALIDTGVDRAHAEFDGCRVLCGPRFARDGAVADAACDTDPHGHGTRLASAIVGRRQGIAPDATLLALAAVDACGAGSPAGLLAALSYVENRGGVDVVALPVSAGTATTDDDRAVLAAAIRRLVTSGVAMIVASGNGGRADVGESANPLACVDGVLSVGGEFRPGVFYERSGRSVRHGVPHLCAPCGRVDVPVAEHPGTWEVWDGGTSYACAAAAAAAACLIGGDAALRGRPAALFLTLRRLAAPIGPAHMNLTTIRLPRPSAGRLAATPHAHR